MELDPLGTTPQGGCRVDVARLYPCFNLYLSRPFVTGGRGAVTSRARRRNADPSRRIHFV